MSKRKMFLALAWGAVVLVVAASTAARVHTSQDVKNQPPRVELKVETAKLEPPAVRAIDETGLAKLLQRDATNTRPLLVNFWATWCDPCRDEFPDLVKIDQEYRARGLDFVLVSLDDVDEIKTTVPAFIEKMRATNIPVYLLNAKDMETAINSIDKTWRGELPATFLFDPHGQIVFNHKGRIKAGELRMAIDKVMSGK